MEKALQVIAQGNREGWMHDRILDGVVEALRKEHPKYNWVGIYLLVGDTLILGPFRGKPTVHVQIPIGEGICGLAARTKDTVSVRDVHDDPRYLACSLETRSEIVVPILEGETVYGEIDIDSDELAAFGETDRIGLERVAQALSPLFRKAG